MDSSDSDADLVNNQINEYMAAGGLFNPNWSINNTRSLNLQQNGSNENQVDSDTSDSDVDTINLDNPTYLKKMCVGFVDTVKEKNETINTYRKMVINSNLQLVQMDSAYQRKMRALKLAKTQAVYNQDKQQNSSSGEIEKDPLTLFPEEVWTILLSQVSDVKDLLNVSRTCLLFQKILNKTKTQWLFESIFPYLFNQLSKKESLRCRLVCKQWTYSVDRFLENFKLLPTYFPTLKPGALQDSLLEPNIIFKPFRFDYAFFSPFRPNPTNDPDDDLSNDAASINSSHHMQIFHQPKNKYIEAMKHHHGNRNPFVGRSVVILEDLNAEVEVGENIHQFLPHAKSILDTFGQHIWHLTINGFSGMQTPLDLWRVLHCSLEKCEGLKSLRISGFLNGRSLQGLLSVSELQVERPSLEVIRIDINSKCMHHLQDKLVSKFSGQLKQFEVKIWREGIYDSLDWGNLQELWIHKGNCEGILDSLMKTERMGNLRKLTITISLNGSGNILEKLVELTKKFVKLSDLVLKFDDGMGATGTTLRKLCDERLTAGVVGSKNLSCLEIHSESYEIVSYDFLLYFPYLSRVTIKHCHSSVEIGAGSSKEMKGRVECKGILNIGKYLAVQIDDTTGKYDLGNKIYGKANIWKYLPFLKVFTVYKGFLNDQCKSVFRRHVYEHFVKNKR